MLGLTVIYIPILSKEITAEKGSNDKDLVKQLENVVNHWITQIKLTLIDEEESQLQELLSIDDEYDFWIYRYDNLCGLNFQVHKHMLERIINILMLAQSIYAQQFIIIREDIQMEIVKARSNIEYLTLLKEPSEKLKQCTTPQELIPILSKIIHLCRTIWLNSPYYNTTVKMTNLFIILSNQISNAHNMFTECPWDLDIDNIFHHIDIFIERCQDMIVICKAMIDFARMDETNNILRPKFAGTKGEEHSRACKKIERLFLESLQKVEVNSHKIFDVLNISWQNIILTFRNEVKELEIIIKNLIETVFVDMNNVQEGIENLYGFYNYMNREQLQELFNNKTMEVWKMFNNDIQFTKQSILSDRQRYSTMMPYYSGKALSLQQKAYNLIRTKKMMEDAEWMPYCSMKFEIFNQCNMLIKLIEEIITNLHKEWIDISGENPRLHLDRHLMKRNEKSPLILNCNMDSFILALCRECDCWINLRFHIPIQITVIHMKKDIIFSTYESILEMTNIYNKCIEALSDKERELFRELIRQLDKQMNPGLNRLTWNTENIENYITECYDQSKKLLEFIYVYKKSNSEIIKLCEKICKSLMITLKPNYAYTLSELQEELVRVRDVAVVDILTKYSTIVQYIIVIFDGFKPVIDNIMKEWQHYLTQFDLAIQEALKFCLKYSMNVMYEALHGNGTTGPSPLLLVQLELVNNKIQFSPNLSDIATTLSNILNHILTPIKNIQRLTEKFNAPSKDMKPLWKVYENDRELTRYQHLLDNEMNYCFSQIQTYLKTWEPFKDVWEVNKDIFIHRYEKLKPTVTSFDSDITNYANIALNVEVQDTVTNVHFLEINCDSLKSIIILECLAWQQKLSSLMLRVTENKVNHVYQYIAENTKKITKEPTDLISMQLTMQLFERLNAEIPKEEVEFPKIMEFYEMLEKYEVPITFEFKRKVKDIDRSWSAYLELLLAFEIILSEKKEDFKNRLLGDLTMFNENIQSLIHKYYDTGPFTSEWQIDDAFTWINVFYKEIHALKEREKMLKEHLAIFGLSLPDSLELVELEENIAIIEIVWKLTAEWNEAWNRYKTEQFWKIEIEEMDTVANALFRKLTRLCRELKERKWEIVEHTRASVDKFRRTLPLITDLKNPAMRPRHWKQVKDVLEREFDETSEDFTLDAIADMQMQNFSEQIADISNAATMELEIELGLQRIAAIWKVMTIVMTPYKTKGIYKLESIDDIVETLEDHQVQLSSMKSTRFVEPFATEVDYWERTLSTVGEVLEMVLSVQRSYFYMDNIFSSEDIRKQLPKETQDFDKLTLSWVQITSRMADHRLALPATHVPPGLLEVLNKLSENLEALQRALEQYLETKRYVFPRFYFISNDDLLEILANSRRPDLIQPHIKKLFENIKFLSMSKSVTGKLLATGMNSNDGEFVQFLHPVTLEGHVENWLCNIEEAMRESLHELLKRCREALRKMLAKRDRWVKEWPSQPGITSTQIQWTTDCTRTLMHCKIIYFELNRLVDSKKPLRRSKKKQNQALAKYSEAIRSDLNNLDRLKFKAIVVIEIHARDVIERMYKNNCKDVAAFEWLSQLRFYWEKDIDNCIVRQTNTHFIYGYEYLGNSGRLVITPLTDRCYITLTTALHLYRGGSPKGPAGTGKTETVKDLGKALGFNVIVQNCSEGLDYISMGRMFSGLAQTGAWGCFDEFNRINIEVLSVVAQQILSILSALSQKLRRFVFESKEISLISTCGIFITMNPGYAGRTELPDNLKSMFRPISMMVPDSSMIAEINLFGEGFQDTRVLARKVFTLYTLAQQQLSKQYHYDFGLRGIVTLTRYAGWKKRLHPNLADEEANMNVAKLTSNDLPLFLGITTDLFPTVDVPTVDYEEIIDYITKEAIKLKLQPIPLIITKVIQLYETKNSRHSTMIVGESNTAKTVTWKILQNTMSGMKNDGKPGYNAVHVYPINPKALNLSELYGEYNLSTGEWLDGVISSIMRKTCSSESSDEKWILFDGPVDAVWIENMNSVMDDNKILTLINNERITMPKQVSLLFEVQDLCVASPATVSRAGMVYNDYKDLGWHPLVKSWLQSHEKEAAFVKEMKELFDRFVDITLEFKHQKCEELVPVPELNSIQSLCKLLDVLARPKTIAEVGNDEEAFSAICKIWFLFCMIWSLCASVNEDSRLKMDNFIRELEGSFPLRDTIYEYYVDVRQRSFVSWEEKLSQSWRFKPGTPFHKIIVPTVDTVRYNYIVSNLLINGYPVLLVGPVGTGKSSIARSALETMDDVKYGLLIINMSAQTTSNNVQEAIESRLEKRTKGVYVPVANKTMITFMDDFNMPMKETYGSQPPLELIRQWIDYGFWYDRQNQQKRHIQKIQLMAAMGPPGGGRNVITNRLLTKFNVINMTFPSEKQIARIYGTMLNQQITDFHVEVKGIADTLTLATITLYDRVVLKMLPTPAKMHYIFNLRDISKIFQGLLRSHKDHQYSIHTFLRLWLHETYRVFCDRFIDEKDTEWFLVQIGELLGTYFELTITSICPDKTIPLFGNFMNAWNIYEDLVDIAAVRRYIEEQMDEYNASTGVVRLDLILFHDAVEHICRIVRVISQPRGNMLLVGIGGSGRQSVSRIAAYMCELTTFQIAVTKQYRVMEFREDLKKLYSITGVENKPTSFLFNDTQVAEEQFLEIVNNMLSTGEVANLYKTDEMEDIKNRLTKEATKAGIIPSTESIYFFLIERVRANMHVILCMSPIGDAFRNRLRQYPSLINCTTIDWFLEWPKEALLEVGNKFLMNLNLTLTITGENKVEPRQSATAIPILPLQDRMREGIASTFASIQSMVSRFSTRMANEMKRYNYVTPTNFLELVFGYKDMLHKKRQDLADQANKLRGGIFKIDDTQAKVNEMAAELEITQEQVQTSTRECEEFLVTIVNQRRDADDAQKMVTAKSLRIAEEQKECKKLEEIARADLATVEPALNEAIKASVGSVEQEGSGGNKVLHPTTAKGRDGNGGSYDSEELGTKLGGIQAVLRAIGRYTTNPEFDPVKVGVVSIAAKSLCMWVIAMEKYGKLYRIVAPKREKLEAALESLRQKEAALTEATMQLQKIQEDLETLQKIFHTGYSSYRQAEMLKIKLDRAAMLVEGLSGERIRWLETVESLREFFDWLPGDCLISTAFVSYLGPFVSNYRDELFAIWMKEVNEKEIPMSPRLDVKEFLADPTTIREWNIQGLPSDGFSTENGIIVTRGTRWPLVIDPQCQAVKWIKNMEAKNALRVIDFGQADFMKVLEQALQFGWPVLLENVGETLDPALNPILERAFIKSGLEAQLLGIVVRKEKPQLEEQKDSLVLTIASGKRTLKELEDRILYLLSEAGPNLLDDLDLLNTLQTSKATSISIAESLVTSEETEREIDIAREEYRSCSRRASILFFVLTDMSLIDPMYQFSLDSYIALFMLSIDKSPKSMKLTERIENLNDYHTYALYKNTCRGLFEQHKLLFSFNMCIKILTDKGRIISWEYAFLLRGGIVLDRENQPDKPVPWLPPETWDNITELDKLPGFHGLISSFEQYPRDWHNWYISTEPENIPLVGELEEGCTAFQRMMIIRSCRPDRMSSAIANFIVRNVEQKFVEPPVLDLKAVLEDSIARTPLIFVLSPGVDPTSILMQLAESQQMMDKFMSLSLGQGQAPIATKMIQLGVKKGLWIFLANCHLSLSWMPKLDKIVETLINNKALNPNFRLWLSSSPTPEFPISILQAGIKMTTEPPKGLKANMKRLYSLVTEAQFDVCQAKSKYKKLLFVLVFFHSVLLERKKFQQLGWNVIYSFNDSDFEVSENLLQVYLDEYPDTPWESLKYLIAGICYGGHVTDDWDRRLLMTYVQQYFTDEVLTVPYYRLSSLPTYYIPRDGSLEFYRDIIMTLPTVDRPEAFGQHPNADITSLIMETRNICKTLMSLQVQTISSEEETNKEEKVIQLTMDVASKIPRNIDYETIDKLIGPIKKPLDVVLLQEISRYNVLLSKTRNSLNELQRGIRGLVSMSPDLEEIFTCIYEGRVPSLWLTAYPSLKLLGAWTRDLINRIEHFATWADTTHPPVLFWLAAFTFPTGFLTAVLQTSARMWNISIDSLTWEFIVQTINDSAIIESPMDGVYVRSMFLEGAGWDKKNAILVEPAPMQLVYDMPVIHFKPTERFRRTKGLYACPTYYYPQRSGDQSRPAFVVTVDLKTGSEEPDLWITRGTALLLSLAV
ncbi:dynein axonemal heavy chain 2 [Vespula squamosa]|uniref:Dynein axonemal heavy chain 2 n=1 Tax=Vespula squamosa TaxID=30214 RepID=A0ABD2BR49_VESSQ